MRTLHTWHALLEPAHFEKKLQFISLSSDFSLFIIVNLLFRLCVLEMGLLQNYSLSDHGTVLRLQKPYR